MALSVYLQFRWRVIAGRIASRDEGRIDELRMIDASNFPIYMECVK